MTAVEFKNKIDSIIFAETPEMQSKLLKKLYKTMIQKKETQQELHICKYCGVETTQPDDECYAKPKQETNNMTAVEWLKNELFTEEYMKNNLFEIFEQALEMEKQQIKYAYAKGHLDGLVEEKFDEEYYDDTYKK
jgi:hypothetical protein